MKEHSRASVSARPFRSILGVAFICALLLGITQTITSPAAAAPTTKVSILAKTTAFNPEVIVYLNGEKIGRTRVVNSRTYRNYSFPLNAPLEAGDRVDVRFANDDVVNGRDRDLSVQRVSSRAVRLTSTGPNVFYDRGDSYAAATDGQDVLPGQEEMLWNGALRFVWPDSTEPSTPSTTVGSTTTTTGPSTTTSPSTTTPRPTTTATTSPSTPTTAPAVTATTSPATTAVPTTNQQPTTTVPAPTTTAAPTTAAPTTAAPTTAPPNTAPSSLDSMRNTNPKFNRYESVRSSDLKLADLTEHTSQPDNGSVGDGQFRVACQYSHFAYDDPILYPGQIGRSHLHMFFGNTKTSANSTTDSLVNSGGGSCNGYELNRSAYWTPALLDGRGNAIVPDMIILYYKSKEPNNVQRMPQGLKMIAGNSTAESFTANDFLYWSCGDSGYTYNKSNRIPNCNGDTINATISFPQCWDGVNMDSADHKSHMALVSPHKPCPSSHPVRLPQIGILLYFPGQSNTSDWYLSSDRSGGFNTGPGATLHADWWGGWNDEAMDLWTNGCMKAARNCSYGQTGTDRMLARLNGFQNYPGNNFVPLP